MIPAVNLIGFDSAWADNPRKPGSICALRLASGEPPRFDPRSFDPPRPAGFAAALEFIRQRHGAGDATLVAIDQPTIVNNETGMRPVERVVASVIIASGGAIQPAYRGTNKAAMFGDGAPIRRFLAALGFADDPEAAVAAPAGGFVMEVYPALALLALDPAFTAASRCGPRYNPSRKTFLPAAWSAVCRAATAEAHRFGLPEVADWCEALPRDAKPRKSLQDDLDAVICLLVAARWRLERPSCVMVGDRDDGYIVAPALAATRARLAARAAVLEVPLR